MLELLLIFIAIICILANNKPLALLIILGFLYSDWIVGSGISDFGILHNYFDVGIFLSIILIAKLKFCVVSEKSNVLGYKWITNGLKIFLCFFVFAIFVDIVYNNVYLLSVIKVVRLWIFLFLIFFVKYFRTDEIVKLFKYLALFTVVLSAVFIVEKFFDISFTGALRTRGGTRASLPWPPAMLVFVLFVTNYFKVNFLYKALSISIIIVNLMLCGSRSYFLAYILCFALYWILGKITLRKIVLLIGVIVVVFGVFSTENILSERFAESKEELQEVKSGSTDVEGNLTFRLLLTKERFEYVVDSPVRFVFGIGCVQEKDFPKNVFSVGLKRDGDIVQIDTGDVSWSLLFIRFGVVGTFVYLFYFMRRYLQITWKNRSDVVGKSLFVYVVTNLLFMSWTYPFIANSIFWVVPILGLKLIKQRI